MSKFDWKQVLGTVAPVLATAVGGPLAGVAVKTIATQLLGKPNASAKEVEIAVLSADPQTLLKLKEIDNEFKIAMEKSGIELEQIASADRASARNREVQLKDNTTKYLAYLITFGFFGICVALLVMGKPVNGGDTLLMMIGSLTSAWIAVVAYHFGSSAGSKAKTDLLSNKG